MEVSRLPQVRRRTGGAGRIIAILAVLLLAWCAFDLFGPRRVDIRAFDADQVARLDTGMWRSYYDRKPAPLFFQLGDLMRRQFHFPLLRSNVAAFYAARAAFVFKRGHDRPEYQRALPDLVRYYSMIRKISATPFDVRRTAQLELEWWIVHRQRGRYTDADLENALADAAAALYRVPPSALMEYGHWRTEAMDIRDGTAAHGGVTEADWRKIEEDLTLSWRSLWKNVQRGSQMAAVGPNAAGAFDEGQPVDP